MLSTDGDQLNRSHAGSAGFAGGFVAGRRWSYCRVIEVCDTSWFRVSGSAGRFAVATEEISAAGVCLASDDSSYITGVALSIAGGSAAV